MTDIDIFPREAQIMLVRDKNVSTTGKSILMTSWTIFASGGKKYYVAKSSLARDENIRAIDIKDGQKAFMF